MKLQATAQPFVDPPFLSPCKPRKKGDGRMNRTIFRNHGFLDHLRRRWVARAKILSMGLVRFEDEVEMTCHTGRRVLWILMR